MKQFLPSKKFISRLIVLALLVLSFFAIYFIRNIFKNSGPSPLNPTKLQIKDVVIKDTNVNGIPDWEEVMWGLDPNTNGQANKDFIVAKRETLAKNNPASDTQVDSSPISENDALSREFFAVIMSLQQTGNLDDNSMKAVSDAIGKKVVATPIDDIYTKNDFVIKDSTAASINEYYTAVAGLFVQYQDKNIGDELSFVATALKNNDSHALTSALPIAAAYKSFGKALVKIPVPNSVLAIDLDLANNYEKTGRSIEGLTHLFDDPIQAMKALINYKKYNDLLVSDIQKLSDNSPKK